MKWKCKQAPRNRQIMCSFNVFPSCLLPTFLPRAVLYNYGDEYEKIREKIAERNEEQNFLLPCVFI